MLHLSKLTQDDSMQIDISRIQHIASKLLKMDIFYYETRARALSILVWFIRVLSIIINALKNKDCYRVDCMAYCDQRSQSREQGIHLN